MSSFAERVNKIVSQIPRSEVLTYKQVAELAGSPRACRAVGNILSKNLDKNVPCYRVIKSDGKIGGYNGLRGEKEKLLRQEFARTTANLAKRVKMC